ncbi:MAG TPA: hypothetical protein VMT16_10500 [Thermoanaerobaculia bacterium]|nr:hypothetical protein [Thermoanaerobaculia bacterium]
MALRAWILGGLERVVPPGVDLDLVLLAATRLLAAAALAAAALLAWRIGRRGWRSRRSRQRPVVLQGAPPGAGEAERDATWWRRELERRLAAGALRPALAALWWWVALRLAPGGPEPAWTSSELVAATGAAALREPLRRLDHLLYGGRPLAVGEVAALLARIEERLP